MWIALKLFFLKFLTTWYERQLENTLHLVLPNQWLDFKLKKCKHEEIRNAVMVSSVCCIINCLIIKFQYRSFVGKLLVVVLAPFRFPVLQVFPDLPDNPAVLKAMVMLRRLVFSITWQSSLYFITAIAILTKRTKQPKIWSNIPGEGFSSMGNAHAAHLWGGSAAKGHP